MNIPIPEEEQFRLALGLISTPTFIATGGFKAVFKVSFADGGEEALKAVYLPKVRQDSDESLLYREQLLARTKREITALRKCDFPAIVKLGRIDPVHKNISGNDFLVYSEEFLPGSSLISWLKSNDAASFLDLHSVMITLVELIENLNKLGYLHRDIKPENIIETGIPSRRFVALDMGIAYKSQGTDLTQNAGPPGTLRYMAPELLQPDYKDNMDFRCDLYSAALTVYVLAAKTHPFAPQPESPYATVYRIMKTTPTSLQKIRPDLPEGFCRIIDRCIRKRPALRYGNIAMIKNELKNLLP